MEFEITDGSKYHFETAPDDGREGRCQHTQRLDVHPSVTIGGVSVERCVNDALPGMVYCYIHTPKEALAYAIRLLDEKVRKLEAELLEAELDALKDPGETRKTKCNWKNFEEN
jgi:hypothetical protein